MPEPDARAGRRRCIVLATAATAILGLLLAFPAPGGRFRRAAALHGLQQRFLRTPESVRLVIRVTTLVVALVRHHHRRSRSPALRSDCRPVQRGCRGENVRVYATRVRATYNIILLRLCGTNNLCIA